MSSRPLVLTQRTVESRLRQLGQKLNDELGFHDQRLRFDKRAMRQGPITWTLGNKTNAATGIVLPRESVAELAPAGNDESMLYFSYNEQWQPTHRYDQIEFVSSNIRFVISGIEAMPDLCFRLEWAGARTIGGGGINFPGIGAAHPHWQFDVDEGWFGLSSEPDGDLRGATIDVNLEPKVEEIDLSSGAEVAVAGARLPISATLAAFHHLHLPARALWHELLCTMPDGAEPQQHTPVTETEIDRWLISALRYLKHEFETNM